MTVGRYDQFTEIPSDRQITVSLLIVGLTLVISNTLGSSRLLRDLRFLTLPYSKRFVCRSFSGIGFHETRNAIACVTGQSARLKIAINLWVIYSKVRILTNDLNNDTIDGPEDLCSLEQCWEKKSVFPVLLRFILTSKHDMPFQSFNSNHHLSRHRARIELDSL